jgi:hypothetical protein
MFAGGRHEDHQHYGRHHEDRHRESEAGVMTAVPATKMDEAELTAKNVAQRSAQPLLLDQSHEGLAAAAPAGDLAGTHDGVADLHPVIERALKRHDGLAGGLEQLDVRAGERFTFRGISLIRHLLNIAFYLVVAGRDWLPPVSGVVCLFGDHVNSLPGKLF